MRPDRTGRLEPADSLTPSQAAGGGRHPDPRTTRKWAYYKLVPDTLNALAGLIASRLAGTARQLGVRQPGASSHFDRLIL